MNMQCNTGVRCDTIQSGVIISGQICQYQVIAYAKYQVMACQLSSVKYQVSGITCQVITCQVPMSDIKCQATCVKYNMSSTGIRSQVSESGVKYNISAHITMHHVLESRKIIIRHVMMVTRHSHINISCNRR